MSRFEVPTGERETFGHQREAFGHDVLGPIMAEFCQRLWMLTRQLQRPDDTALLFCSRGGLRLKVTYERFLHASGLPSGTLIAPLMVSRLAAIRPLLVSAAATGVLPSAAAHTLADNFTGKSLGDAARAMSGVDAGKHNGVPFTVAGFIDLLRSSEAPEVVASIAEQSALFTRHLHSALDGRRGGILVDTGIAGTLMQFLQDGFPEFDFNTVFIARANYRRRPAPHFAKTIGLSVESDIYAPYDRRTAMLRYWYLIEDVFEPDLPSVARFEEREGVVRSNLQQSPDWEARLLPEPGSIFAGVLRYIDALPAAPGSRVVFDAHRAWRDFHRSIIWPDADLAGALDIASIGMDFGTETTETARPWRGAVPAMRGSSIWREGEIARSRTRLRVPLLALLQTAYSLRRFKRTLMRR